jgi:hypothetical protein
MAAENIKRLSYTGQKLKIITAWVERYFPIPEEMRTFM